MKIIKSLTIYIPLLVFVTFFTSCANRDDEFDSEPESDDVQLDIQILTRDATNPEYLEDISQFFNIGESSILISQRTETIGFNFDERSSNCYVYVYNPPEDLDSIDWEKGYNYTSNNPMSWQKILTFGQYVSGWSFGALYFPRSYSPTNHVLADQSDNDSFIVNDILGAYHFTSDQGSRLRFQFNHLMCRLKVNLYIPVFSEETGDGFDFDEINAYGLSFRTDFNLNFAERTTEEPPLADPDNSIAGNIKDIIMYLSEGPIDHFLSSEDLKNFKRTQPEDGDNVRKYTFEMIFPQQAVEGNILRFIMKRGNISYNYLLDTNLTKDQGNFTFTRGSITELELYLPRNANEIVLLRAYMHDWNEARASFTITEEKPDEK